MEGSRPNSSARARSKWLPNSRRTNGCRVRERARPPSRFTPLRRRPRALEPVRKKAHAVFFDHQMHFVQQRRQPLDLVDGHHFGVGLQRFPDQARLPREAQEQGLVEKVVGRDCCRISVDLPVCLGPNRKQERCFKMLRASRRRGMFGADTMIICPAVVDYHANPRHSSQMSGCSLARNRRVRQGALPMPCVSSCSAAAQRAVAVRNNSAAFAFPGTIVASSSGTCNVAATNCVVAQSNSAAISGVPP